MKPSEQPSVVALVQSLDLVKDNKTLAHWLQAMGCTLAMLHGISGVIVRCVETEGDNAERGRPEEP